MCDIVCTSDTQPMQANKLSTVKKCLNEVLKYGGPFSPRELYPVRILWVPYRGLCMLTH